MTSPELGDSRASLCLRGEVSDVNQPTSDPLPRSPLAVVHIYPTPVATP